MQDFIAVFVVPYRELGNGTGTGTRERKPGTGTDCCNSKLGTEREREPGTNGNGSTSRHKPYAARILYPTAAAAAAAAAATKCLKLACHISCFVLEPVALEPAALEAILLVLEERGDQANEPNRLSSPSLIKCL